MPLRTGDVVGPYVIDEVVREGPDLVGRFRGHEIASGMEVVILEREGFWDEASGVEREAEVRAASRAKSELVESLVAVLYAPTPAYVVAGPAGVPLTKLAAMPPGVATRVTLDVLAALDALHTCDSEPIFPVALGLDNMHLLPSGRTRIGHPALPLLVEIPTGVRAGTSPEQVRFVATMSPSLIRGERRSVEQDLHTVAACFRELVLGRPAFEENELFALVREILRGNTLPPLGAILWPIPLEPPRRPAAATPSLSQGGPFRSASSVERDDDDRGGPLDRALERASMAHGPGRYRSASTFAVDLAAAVEPASHREVAAWVREVSGV